MQEVTKIIRMRVLTIGGFIKGILRGVRCTKSLRVLFLHRRPPSWTTLVLYSRAVFIFNEPALLADFIGGGGGGGESGDTLYSYTHHSLIVVSLHETCHPQQWEVQIRRNHYFSTTLSGHPYQWTKKNAVLT
jgi:hypothetical protein